MPTTTLEVNIRKEFGRARIYPANEAAQILAQIAGTKTLHPVDLERAKLLGHQIHISYDADCMTLAAAVLRKVTP